MFTKRLLILLLFCLTVGSIGYSKNSPVLTEQTSTLRSIEEDFGNSTTITYSFPECELKELKANNSKYHLITVDGFNFQTELGKPSLPVRNDLISIPQGASVVIDIISSDYTEINDISILPAQAQHRDSDIKNQDKFYIDSATYNTDTYYPQDLVELVDIQYQNNLPLAIVKVSPVQFNPLTKTARVYTNLSYQVSYKTASKRSSSYSTGNVNASDLNFVQLSVINTVQSTVKTTRSVNTATSTANEYDYLIIAHQAYSQAAEKFSKWKKQLGYTVETIYDTDWNSEKVKDSIAYRYHSQTEKPTYFLILGDHDGDYAVPGELVFDPDDAEQFATDLYYACMDGDDDYIPDMAHGRIPARSPEEAMRFVNRMINYEKNPPANESYYSNVLACSYFQDDDDNGYADRRFCHTSEEIKDYLSSNFDYNVSRVYTTNSTNPVYYDNTLYSNGDSIPEELLMGNGFNWYGDKYDIAEKYNEGNILVYHRDHGFENGSGWVHPGFNASNLELIDTSASSPIVLSINCYSGKYMLQRSFAEKLLDKNAIAVVAAANYSFSGYNDAIIEGIIEAGWPGYGLTPDFGAGGKDDIETTTYEQGLGLGEILNIGLNKMLQEWNGSQITNRYEYEIFHLFGDPSLKIWNNKPEEISANHEGILNCGDQFFSVTDVSVDGLATLISDDDIIGTCQVVGGSGTIYFDEPITDKYKNLILTISDNNYIPYIDTIDVDGNCTVPPIALFTADNNSGCLNSVFELTESSYLNAENIKWEFEPNSVYYLNESTDTSRVISVGFNSSGNYNVSLIATNEYGSDTLVKNNYIEIKAVQANCMVNKTTLSVGESLNLFDISECSAETRKWIISPETGYSYINESSDTNTNPSICFTGTGEYTINLIAENSIGSDTAEISIAVNDYLVIGESELSNIALPIEPYYNYSCSQSIIQGSEIPQASEINAVAFYWNGNSTWDDTIQVYLSHTTKDEFSSETDWSDLDENTLVYDSIISVQNSEGWLEIPFTKPFSYNGVDNIIITVVEENKGYHSNNDAFYCSYTDTKYQSLVYFNDYQKPQLNTSFEGSLVNAIPNVKFSFNEPQPMALDTVIITELENARLFNGVSDQKLIELKIVTSGHAYAVTVDSLSFDISASSDLVTISEARIYSGRTDDSNGDVEVSSLVVENDQIYLPNTISLLPDTNYFWISVSVDESSETGEEFDISTKVCNVNGKTDGFVADNFDFTIEELTTQWTWLFYADEASFERSLQEDLDKFTEIYPENSLLNYLVYYDSETDSLDGLYEVHEENEEGVLVKTDLKVLNTDNINQYDTWKKLIAYIKTNYSAEAYGLSLKYKSENTEYSANNANAAELNYGGLKPWVISSALEYNSLQLEVLSLECALLNQFEIFYEFKDVANYVLINNDSESDRFWYYEDAFTALINYPSLNTNQLLVALYAYYNESDLDITAASMDSFNNNDIPLFNSLVDTLINYFPQYRSQFVDIISNITTDSYTYQQRDYATFIQALSVGNTLPKIINTLAQDVLENSFLFEKSTDIPTHIFLPLAYTKQSAVKEFYHNDSLYLSITDTHWDEFIDSLLNHVAGEIELNNEKLEISTCNKVIYDNGGDQGKYKNNMNGILTIYPDTTSMLVELNIEDFNIENGWDYLNIYNGNNTSTDLVGSYSGTDIPAYFASTSDDGSLTLQFVSDEILSEDGFKISVTCADMYSYENSSIVACEGDSVFLDNEYYFESVEVYDTLEIENTGFKITTNYVTFLPVLFSETLDTSLCSYDALFNDYDANEMLNTYQVYDTFCMAKNYRLIQLPAIQIDLGVDTVLSFNDTYTLEAGDEFQSYFWNNGSTSESLTIDDNYLPGTHHFQVKVVDTNNCTAVDSITIELLSKEIELTMVEDNILSIYPNPAKDIILMSVSSNDNNARIHIYNAKGILVQDLNMYSDEMSIDVSGLPSGMYYFKIFSEDNSEVQRVVVDH